MPDSTPHLGLPLIAAGQAQKHVTHNEALALLDVLIQLACLDKDLTAPPADPAEGDRYLVVAPAPTGAWSGRSGQVVSFTDGVWDGIAPSAGWLAYVADEKLLYVFDGLAWTVLTTPAAQAANPDRLGINTQADSTNRLAVKSNAALFSWDDVTPGSGDMRVTLNKGAVARDAGFVFQDGWSTRALFGTLGGDDVVLKTSPDGSTFNTALVAAAATGIVSFPVSPTAPTPDPADNSRRLASTAYVDRAVSGVAGTRTPVPDADYAVRVTDRTVAVSSLSAPRTLKLPQAATYPRGTTLTVVDEAGACAANRSVTLACAQGDTINGLATFALTTPYGYLAVQTDGASRWTIVGRAPLANRASFTDVVLTGDKQIIESGYRRIALQGVQSDAGGNWDSQNNWYVCPRSGIYQITASVRIDNSLSEVTQYGFGIHTREEEGPGFLWHFSGTGKAVRSSGSASRLSFQNAGDRLRLVCATDPVAAIVAAGMQILLVCEAAP